MGHRLRSFLRAVVYDDPVYRRHSGPGVRILPSVDAGTLPAPAAVVGPHLCHATAEVNRLRHELEDAEAELDRHRADWAAVLPAIVEIGDTPPALLVLDACPWCAHPGRPDENPRRIEEHREWCAYRRLVEYTTALRTATYSGIDPLAEPGEATVEDMAPVR